MSSPAFVFGAAGFVGGELVRLILGHPRLALAAAASGSHAGQPLAAAHPNLRRLDPATPAETASFVDPEQALDRLQMAGPAVVFLAVDHQDAPVLAERIAQRVPDPEMLVLVDLSGGHRLRDAALYETWYGFRHPAPQTLADWQYALPELGRRPVARRIANPGCFATAVTLALLPLVRAGLAGKHVAVTAVTGSSGAGAGLRATTHHPRRAHNLRTYKPLAHQHTPEVLATLADVAPSGEAPAISFVPQGGPFVRGLYVTVHACVTARAEGADDDADEVVDVHALYASAYADAPCVCVLPSGELPELAALVGSSRCDLGVTQRGSDLVLVSALDNLLKGAAGQALQNVNLALGWPETLGVPLSGPYPI